MLTLVVVLSIVWFAASYLLYGRRLQRKFGLDDGKPTPAVTIQDGLDYCPARTPVLFGHHFSSIAGAGPIVGPVIGGLLFGWGPALAWILLGSVLIGGVHDMGALVASIRHRARSIAEVARETISPAAWRLFLVFIWLTLVLVLACFIDLTAQTYVTDKDGLDGGSVATSSALYILLALGFGIVVYRLKMPLWIASLVFVPLVFVGIWVGLEAPVARSALALGGLDAAGGYTLILIVYCAVASLTPVWILLQPRDYLSAYLLFACLAGGTLGVLAGGHAVEYPMFLGFMSDKGPIFPFLFILIACGACSGFHSIVASGTTAKQTARESDALRIGYGAMLLEGLLAVLALATIMVMARGSALANESPTVVFAAGFGRFTAMLGIPKSVGVAFGLLAISTFLLTTLDTCTRLARFMLEEFVGSRAVATRWIATAVTLAFPVLLLNLQVADAQGQPMAAYRMIWPLFGATNQLLGGLALLTITMWLRRSGKSAWFTALPCAFMVVTTSTALVLEVIRLVRAGLAEVSHAFQAGYCAFLLLLTIFLVIEAYRALARKPGVRG
ncbi:MAG: carbon starvation protein A [Planctomycetes bacterium]|nr:carbon starvation protein A [Planctomycetota bacterium]